MARNIWTTFVVLAAMLVAVAAQAAGGANKKNTARTDEPVSLRSSPSGGRVDAMYSVPQRSRLRVMKTCVEHGAMVIRTGDDKEPLSFGDPGCTDFTPGFVVAGGETVYCDNGSGVERSCALVGVLESSAPRSGGRRVRFVDLR